MRKLVWGRTFKRAYKKIIKRQPEMKNDIIKTIQLLSKNPFMPALETHKLHGKLAGAWACSIDYDLRIIFDFVKHDDEEAIFLMEIGSHEEVY
ncbi:type II toxin-antitoxin system mRNA interferase toxin, RelE/StbE family [candidate division WOR-3 bacterium]|nr:type II toxin-antitoxin system mRNA interferase toxin, RelE/StbE family [candidate division WOR-3 bacterium]